MFAIDSSLEDSIKPHVLTIITSLSSMVFTTSNFEFASAPKIISLSTRFLLQPKDINPTLIIVKKGLN